MADNRARATKGRLRHAANKIVGLQRAARSVIAGRERSPLAQMLSSTSGTRSSAIWSQAQMCAVLVSIVVHVVQTVDGLSAPVRTALSVGEMCTSLLFTVDYLLRVWTCQEKKKYAHLGPITARLRWMCSRDGLLAAASCVPFYVEGPSVTPQAPRSCRAKGAELPAQAVAGCLQGGQGAQGELPWPFWLGTLVHLAPVGRLIRTARWRQAVSTSRRILFVNRNILWTSLALVSIL